MRTATHALLALTALARPDAPRLNATVVAGALVPDLAIFVMAAWAGTVAQIPAAEIWDDVYFRPFWQEVFAVTNSAPIYALLVLLGFVFKVRWVWLLGAAALIHLAGDLPLHHDDGHPHFWPITSWIFESPVSYWDPRHFGRYFVFLELSSALLMIVLLWKRFPYWIWRAGLTFAGLTYSTMLYFIFVL